MENSMREEGVTLEILTENPKRYQFLQLMRLLDFFKVIQKFYFIPKSGLGFPASEIDAIDLKRDEITFTFMGLYGVDSPLPLYYVYEVSRLTEEAKAFRGLLDIFNHRLYQLFYDALRMSKPLLLLEQNRHEYLDYLMVFSGYSLNDEDKREFAFAFLLGAHHSNALGLEVILKKFLNASVEIQQNHSHWVMIDRAQSMGNGLQLSDNFVIGHRALDNFSRIQIVISNISLDNGLKLLPHALLGQRLRRLLNRYMAPHISYQIKLVIDPEASQILELGKSECILGMKLWFGTLAKGRLVEIVCS